MTTLPDVAVDPKLAKRLSVAAARVAAAGELRRKREEERDQLILEAVAAGNSLREVARLCDLSHVSVRAIVKKATP